MAMNGFPEPMDETAPGTTSHPADHARPVRRLLIVTTSAVTVKTFLLPFANHFRAAGWKVDAMAQGIEGCQTCRTHFDQVHDVAWSRRPMSSGNLHSWRNVREVVVRGEYDIVHMHTPVAAFVTRLALAWPLRGKRPAMIYTAHGFHFHEENDWVRNLIFKTLERVAGRWTDFLVTMNRTDELAALRLRLVPPDRLWYMPGIGIARTWFHPTAVPPSEVAALRVGLGIPDAAPVFVMIAEFISRKQHANVVKAIARVNRKSAHFIFVGDGPLRGVIEGQVKALGVDRIYFAGSQADVRPFILMARAVILSSFQEGLPRSVMEALSCGIPVIGSAIRGIQDLLADGGGLLFPVGDVNALAARIEWFVDNPEEARKMGAKAMSHMDKYDIAHIIALHEDLYSRAIQAQ